MNILSNQIWNPIFAISNEFLNFENFFKTDFKCVFILLDANFDLEIIIDIVDKFIFDIDLRMIFVNMNSNSNGLLDLSLKTDTNVIGYSISDGNQVHISLACGLCLQ